MKRTPKLFAIPVALRRFLPHPVPAHLKLGVKGERLATRLLRALDIEILHRNFRGPHGEIDIVARDGIVLCFVEVKTRRSSVFSRPVDAVDDTKKRRIVTTADRYLRRIGHPRATYRFDIVEITVDNDRPVDVRYWPNEFSRGDWRQPEY